MRGIVKRFGIYYCTNEPLWSNCVTGEVHSISSRCAASGERCECNLRKTNWADKRRVYVSAHTPHFHGTKGNSDFYNSRSDLAQFPQVSWWENALFFLDRSSVTQKIPHQVFVSLPLFLIGFLWKFRLTWRGPLSLVVAWHPVSTCPSVRLIKSLRDSWSCYFSCLKLLLIDSCLANKVLKDQEGSNSEVSL